MPLDSKFVTWLNNVDWLSVAGSIASIIGLWLTYKVWAGLKSLRRFYVSRATVPQQLNELSQIREQIVDQLSGRFSEENKTKIIELLAEAKVNIDNLSPKIKEVNRADYENSIAPKIGTFYQTYDYFISNGTKDTAREVGLKLFELVRAIQLLMQDDDWRRVQ